MSILIVLVSEGGEIDIISGLSGFAQAYYLFKDEGVELTLASQLGGWPWPGLVTRYPGATGSLARLAQDGAAREELADTLSLDQVCVDDFAGAYCVGLPGPIWRAEGEATIEAVLARFLRAGKPIAVLPSNLDLSPHGAGDGLLITGEATQSALLAAQTLLSATRARAGP